ncbi:MAG: tripartite tricarboxylate transporter TctB family protein [Candidatus Rokubacteria bacterium]|nr:tripartite tricarboxylate transporter TctB family protein [Candidatus Rokubacteria bacterium]
MKRAEPICGVILLGLAAACVVEALRIRDDWQGAKLVPAVLSMVFVLLAAGHLMSRRRSGPSEGDPSWPDAEGWRRVGLVFGALVAYVLALPYLGFLPATAALLLGLIRLLGAFSWPVTVVLTAVTAVASHVVFKLWLGMPLPAGPLGL